MSYSTAYTQLHIHNCIHTQMHTSRNLASCALSASPSAYMLHLKRKRKKAKSGVNVACYIYLHTHICINRDNLASCARSSLRPARRCCTCKTKTEEWVNPSLRSICASHTHPYIHRATSPDGKTRRSAPRVVARRCCVVAPAKQKVKLTHHGNKETKP